jgi:hypothetical protein
MHRPFGITVLAIIAGLAALAEIWRALVFMGIASFTFVGQAVSFPEPQWGSVFWAVVLAAIWIWVAMGFWNVRAYAWSFGNFIAMFTLIFSFFAVLGNSTLEAESVPILLAIIVLFYLNYAGVRDAFIKNEMDRLTPEQRAAMENVAKANAAAAAAMATPAAPAAPAAPTTPPAPPSDPGTPAG